jgi:hypothetical protein
MKKLGVALLLSVLICSPCWADDGQENVASAIWAWVLSLVAVGSDSSPAPADTNNFFGTGTPNGIAGYVIPGG